MKGLTNMYNVYKPYPCPYYVNTPMYQPYNMPNANRMYPYPIYDPNYWRQFIKLKDYGPQPYVVNIEEATKQNNTFRTALWTGENLQLTLMSINVGEDIGLEIHPDHDQFIRIEEGQGIIKMGDRKDQLDFQAKVYEDYAIFLPAGKWHNLINTGSKPLKLYSIYAPPQHTHGTVHETKADAKESHEY